MAQKKSHEVDAFLKRPNQSIVIILLYGPDKGLVSERATVFVKNIGLALDNPFAVIRIEAEEINVHPERLINEIYTIPMFGGERLIWIRNAGNQKSLVDVLKLLSCKVLQDMHILIEANDLKKGAALRTIVENTDSAMALPCYRDDAHGINSVIDEILSRDGIQITLDARRLLCDNLGGDRLATRSEVEKLCLYVQGKEQIDIHDVHKVIGDVSSLSIDESVNSVLTGNLSHFHLTFDRIIKSGSPPFLILNAAIRQFQQLTRLRYTIEEECQTISAAISLASPPIFFNHRKLIEIALNRWTGERLTKALERLHKAVLDSRHNTTLAVPIIRQLLLSLAIEATHN